MLRFDLKPAPVWRTHMAKEHTVIGSNGVWLVTCEHVSKKHGKTYKRRRKVASPNRGPIKGRES